MDVRVPAPAIFTASKVAPSVVRSTVPSGPTSQQTFGAGEVPPATIAPVGIVASCHDDPPFVDRSTTPARIRQRRAESGEGMSTMAASARRSAATDGAGGDAGGGGADVAAAAPSRSDKIS